MKKLYTLLVVALVGFVGTAQIVNIPDANFKAKLLESSSVNSVAINLLGVNFRIDANGDGNIQASEALEVKSLSVGSYSIISLEGIQYFTNVENLNFSVNQVSSFNFPQLINLKNLSCTSNNIQSLDVTAFSNLRGLGCDLNPMVSLNVAGLINLLNLSCSSNLLQNLDVSSLISLKTLQCCCNQISSLDITNNQDLETLECYNNQITSLLIDSNPLLKYIECSNNQITSLNVNGLYSLQSLFCDNNNISVLDTGALTSLGWLGCSQNNLTSLDVRSSTNITRLYCVDNQLTSLLISTAGSSFRLECNNNLLSVLDLSQIIDYDVLLCNNNLLTNIIFPEEYTFIDQAINLSNNLFETLVLPLGRANEIYCDNNPNLTALFMKDIQIGNSSDLYLDYYFTLTNCPNLSYICTNTGYISSTQTKVSALGYNCNVNDYCSFFPGGLFYIAQGSVRYDSDANGCSASDMIYPNLRITAPASQGGQGVFMSNPLGNYVIPLKTGNNIITPNLENPTYFNISPTSYTVNFATAINPFIQNFCVTSNGFHNDLEVAILPIGIARPGFDANYKVIYRNKGTAAQSGTVNFVFDDSKIDFVSATPNVTTQATNNLSWSFNNLLPFQTREILVILNLNSPMETPVVNGGDILNYTSTVTGVADETPNDNSTTLNQTVVNSFDPNDKTCIEGTTITPSMVGKYVHYVIRFENTGTANAQNIVVKDMINTSKFDVSSLVPLSGSAAYATRITNTNQVEFIFQNINLPFDDANNDGYIAFKIKTKPTLVVGNTFSNAASIYFDYNFPIVTDTFTTTIATLGNQDFDFGSVFTLSPVPAKNNLTITFKQDIMISSVSIYNTLGQLVQVNTNPNENIDVSGLQSGSYFIRITSDKGSATGKFIKE